MTRWIKRYFVPRASTVAINSILNCRNKINYLDGKHHIAVKDIIYR